MYFRENSSMKKKELTLIVKIKYFPLSKKKINTKIKKMMNEKFLNSKLLVIRNCHLLLKIKAFV